MDGYVKIGTKLDSSGIDKGIKALERKIQQAEEEKIVIETNMDKTQVELNEVNAELDKMKASADELRSKFSGVKGNLSYDQLLAKQDYDAMLPTIDALDKKQSKINDTLTKQQLKYNKINNQVQTYKEKIDSIELKQQQKAMDKLSGSAGKVVKSVVRWSLAAIGVRSIYNGIRSLISNVSQYNEDIANDMQYMGFALASIFEPIVRTIVNWLYKILSLVNQISMVFFGKNLFQNAGVDKFQKAMGGAAKSSKEIKNNLAGFDDLNVLTSDDSSSSGGGGIKTPSMDLSQMGGEVPQWLLVLKEILPVIASALAGVIAGVIALKLGLSGIQALGIGTMVFGILFAISSLLAYLKDPTWNNFGGIIVGIGAAIGGLGLIIGNLPLVIAGIITAIVGLIVMNWESIKSFLDNAVSSIYGLGDTVSNWIISKLDSIMKNFGYFGVGVAGIIMVLVNTMTGLFGSAISAIMNLFDGLFTGIRQIFDGIIKIAQGDLKGGLELVFKGIGNIFVGVLNFIIDAINAFLSPLRSLIVTAGQVTGNNWTMEDIRIPNIPKLAKGGIISKPTQAIIGEAGREAVVPLENNTEWLDMLADRLENISGKGITVSGKGPWSQFLRFLNFELEKSKKNKGTNFIGGTVNG